MLILTRKKGQKIIVGKRSVTIQVLDVKNEQVKLGLSAPKKISVHREEIYDRIEKNNERTK